MLVENARVCNLSLLCMPDAACPAQATARLCRAGSHRVGLPVARLARSKAAILLLVPIRPVETRRASPSGDFILAKTHACLHSRSSTASCFPPCTIQLPCSACSDPRSPTAGLKSSRCQRISTPDQISTARSLTDRPRPPTWCLAKHLWTLTIVLLRPCPRPLIHMSIRTMHAHNRRLPR